MDIKLKSLLWVTPLFALALPGLARGEDIFSDKPIWSSGTTLSGVGGIARFIDFDRDGYMDFVTSLPDPKCWVL